MNFSKPNSKATTIIKGRQDNYVIIIWTMAVYQFIFMFLPIWNLYTLLPILVVFLSHKTSWFHLKIHENSILVKKKIFGIPYFRYKFNFQSYRYIHDYRISEFSTNNQKIEFLYEEFEMDEFGVKVYEKYHSLGNTENSNLSFNTLREWIKNKNHSPFVREKDYIT